MATLIVVIRKLVVIIPVADPGLPVGGCGPIGGHGPLTWVLFGKNVCKNKRIGSCREGMHLACPLDLPMHAFLKLCQTLP